MTTTHVNDRKAAAGFGEGKAAALEVLERYIPERDQTTGASLECEGVSVCFGGVQALADVSIRVGSGQFVGLIGPNGAGKSTLFNALNGLQGIDQGRVHLFGQDVTRATPWDRSRMGMARTFQGNHVNPELTVHENLMAGAHNMIPGGMFAATFRLPKSYEGEKRAQEAARAVARVLDLESAGDLRVKSLDFGAQRRVEIGRGLMGGPRLLLLDEPSAGLDAGESVSLFRLVKQLQVDLALPVLLVEHFVQVVLDNASLVYCLDRGRIIAAGSPQHVASDPAVRSAYLGDEIDA